MWVEPKNDFPLQECTFYPSLTLMTSQMAILFKRPIFKNHSNFFYNTTYIQDAAKNNFMSTTPMQVKQKMISRLQDSIFTLFWLLWCHKWQFCPKSTILKNCWNFFHNSIHIIGCWQVHFFSNHTNGSRTQKTFFPPRLYFLPYFESYDVTNGHFAQKGHPQKSLKVVS